jgi:hypothetical protein
VLTYVRFVVKPRFIAGILFLGSAPGCEHPTSTRGSSNVPASTSFAAATAWLPVGTKVPVGQSIDAPPEPYDRIKHGPLLLSPGSDRGANGVSAPRNFGSRNATETNPIPGDGDRGFFWDQITRPWYGAAAVYDVNMSLALPTVWSGTATWVYAPTMLPPGGSCLEATQVYRRNAGGATTGKFFGIWDFCESGTPGQFDVWESQDPVWHNKHVRTYQGKPTYSVSITTINTGSTVGQCWYGSIYDYLAGGWVQKLSRCGFPTHNWAYTGWTKWESHFLMHSTFCPTLAIPSIRSLDIVLYDPYTGTPTPFTNWPTDLAQLGPKGSCWVNGNYTFDSPVPGLSANSWRANTPNP